MEKLNELVERSNEIADFYDNSILVDNKTILAIAEAFRALEQRAEAAEAKLAELEKQDPRGFIDVGTPEDEINILTQNKILKTDIPLFTRPAPAINLAELVPNKMNNLNVPVFVFSELDPDSFIQGANWVRSTILRNIEDAK